MVRAGKKGIVLHVCVWMARNSAKQRCAWRPVSAQNMSLADAAPSVNVSGSVENMSPMWKLVVNDSSVQIMSLGGAALFVKVIKWFIFVLNMSQADAALFVNVSGSVQ